MQCLSCKYDLSNLTDPGGGHRCPECGRAFDPGNPRTFRHQASGREVVREGALIFGITFVAINAVPFVLISANPSLIIDEWPAVLAGAFVSVVGALAFTLLLLAIQHAEWRFQLWRQSRRPRE